MSDDEFELVRGSENVFRDFGEPSAELLPPLPTIVPLAAPPNMY